MLYFSVRFMLEVHVSNHTMLIDRAYGIIVHLAFVSYMVMLDMLISGTSRSERRGSIEPRCRRRATKPLGESCRSAAVKAFDGFLCSKVALCWIYLMIWWYWCIPRTLCSSCRGSFIPRREDAWIILGHLVSSWIIRDVFLHVWHKTPIVGFLATLNQN